MVNVCSYASHECSEWTANKIVLVDWIRYGIVARRARVTFNIQNMYERGNKKLYDQKILLAPILKLKIVCCWPFILVFFPGCFSEVREFHNLQLVLVLCLKDFFLCVQGRSIYFDALCYKLLWELQTTCQNSFLGC
jgi:hypothetical protein